jgi:hypothetical protein
MCDRRLFGLSGGLRCTGSGVGHTHVYISSEAPDAHTAEVQES